MAHTHDVPTEIIRRDLDKLTRRGVLNRAYGGAVRTMDSGPTVTERHQLSTEEHECITRDAVHCMRKGRIFMIGSGTTTVYAARRMASELRDIMAITHAFGIATALSANPIIRMIVVPGEYCVTKGVMTGVQALRFPNQFVTDYTLLGTGGITADGSSEALIDSEAVYRVMVQRAAKSIVVANHSKFDLTYPYHYVGWSGISRLIADQPLPDHLATVLGREKVVVAYGHTASGQQ